MNPNLRPPPPIPFVNITPQNLCEDPRLTMTGRVAAWLQHIGVSASNEYPGFVWVDAPAGLHWSFGTDNSTWDGDLASDQGEPQGRYIVLPFASRHESDGRDIAVAICAAMIVEVLTPAQIAYAASPERGDYRGFAALHDFCDANDLLPGASSSYSADDTTLNFRFAHDVMDAVTAMLLTLGEDSRA